MKSRTHAAEGALYTARVKRMHRFRLFALLLASAIANPAQAEEFTRRRLILPDGGFEITGEPARPKILGINLSEHHAFEPIYLAPHFYFGASGDVTLGITHERGLCLTGRDGGCGDKPYNDAGFAVLAGLISGTVVELDLHVVVPVRSFDPFVIGARTGALGRIRLGNVAFVFDPYVYVGFNRRDAGNREYVSLPCWVYFQTSPRIAPFVGAAIAGPLDEFSERHIVPLEGGVVFEVTDSIDLGAVLRFHNALGQGSTADLRELGMLARSRF